MRRRGLSWLAAIAACAGAGGGVAAECTLDTQSVAFGSYNPIAGMYLDGIGSVSVQCDEAVAYTLSISTGNGTYVARELRSAADVLHYNLYTDPTRTTVWGDGTGGSQTVDGSGTDSQHDVYGRIEGNQQTVRAGNYFDNIMVTVTY